MNNDKNQKYEEKLAAFRLCFVGAMTILLVVVLLHVLED